MSEQRLARLESHMEHVQGDIGEIKTNLQRLEGKFDALKDSVGTLRIDMEKRFGEQRVWFLLMGAGILSVIARAFNWL